MRVGHLLADRCEAKMSTAVRQNEVCRLVKVVRSVALNCSQTDVMVLLEGSIGLLWWMLMTIFMLILLFLMIVSISITAVILVFRVCQVSRSF